MRDSKNLEDINILSSYKEQYDCFLQCLKKSNKIVIGTLGPTGTSSYYALQYLLKTVKEFENIEVKIVLRDNFNEVHKDLLEGRINFALIPNAYENITEMYWNTVLKHTFSFLLSTPEYGIATTKENLNKVYDKDYIVSIGACSPVLCLIPQLASEQGTRFKKYKVIPAKSTRDAANMLVEGKIDYALTNATSAKACDLTFISSKFYAEVLWTLFMKKDEYKYYIK